MTAIRFFVPERPFVKQRPRFGRGRTWTPAETAAAEQAVRHYARRALPDNFRPFEGPVRLTLEFRFARAARQSAGVRGSPWHFMSRSGDLDNAVKLVSDALNPGAKLIDRTDAMVLREYRVWYGLWLDDGQVASLRAEKLWADDEHPEGTTICVEEL